jgi:hypothetical protein
MLIDPRRTLSPSVAFVKKEQVLAAASILWHILRSLMLIDGYSESPLMARNHD